MSMVHCEGCDKDIDTDFDAEHFVLAVPNGPDDYDQEMTCAVEDLE